MRRHTFLDVEVVVGTRTYAVHNLPARDFESLSWVSPSTHGRAIIEPGRNARDSVRHAIQVLSGDYPAETHYSHIGWRRIAGAWAYLHAGGAIGADGPVPGATVCVEGALNHFELPDPASNAHRLPGAIRASMRLLRAAPPRISAPLFCLVCRSPLDASDFSVHFAGVTGAVKSVLAALYQQHWGAAMGFNNCPASWTSTANANEALRYVAKDTLLLMDDLAPDTATRAAIDRTFRGQANGAGRDRMRADGTLRPTKRPRGTLLSTGEDTPMNHSAAARALVLMLGRGDVDWREVTECQRDADGGRYALMMAGYVQWLAPRLDEIRAARTGRVQELRAELTDGRSHRRTPGISAELLFGMETWLRFATEVGGLTSDELGEFVPTLVDGVIEAAAAQSALQRDADPVTLFRHLVCGAIAGGRGHIAATSGGAPQSSSTWGWHDGRGNGACIGWVEGDHLYLSPANAYSVAAELAVARNVAFPGERILWTALRERGMLRSIDEAGETNKIRRRVQGREERVLHLFASFVTGDPDAGHAEVLG